MDYKTVLREGIYEFEEKKSVFIGYTKRVENENEAKIFIDKIKHKHSDARHNVYGYIIGKDMMIQRYTDDGEPQGTAGIPIIEVIKKNDLKDIVVVVTRYFGGTLLGVGGLTRAYVKSASGAIKNSQIANKILGNNIKIKVNYDLIGKIQYFFNENKIDVKNIQYEDKVIFEIRCEKNNLEEIKLNIIELTSNNLDIEIGEDVMYFKSEGKYYLDNEI
ncbi:YigZ family protein [Candidatus Arthromitus sp. SFB-turkey]|uniref:YigZ family protein n=1 Tax=Candidatus Arthromitus sp. SFB-turkey TaxID=1840217 RepID=UPI0007F3AC3D|nr:YigZ family protein [Candidatus Arthromitus sp. SFB-turkey]OAT89077.1 YigZ family protein [Candidatus Arthromitus sp. SFB-turkey]HJD00590.1 YigZ family protein [Candidatus Dwaynia gallinarum]